MSTPTFESVNVGDALPELPIEITTRSIPRRRISAPYWATA